MEASSKLTLRKRINEIYALMFSINLVFHVVVFQGPDRNVPKCMTHAQSHCFCSLKVFLALLLPSPWSLFKFLNVIVGG